MRAFYAITLLLIVSLAINGCSGDDAVRESTAEHRFGLAMEEYNDENYLDALQHFDVIRLQFPGSSVSDSARFYSGMSRYHREEFLLASYEFNQVRLGAPSSALLSDAQYMYAMSYVALSPDVPLDQTYTIRAIDAVQTFIELYPKHEKADEAAGYIQDLYNKLAEKEFNTGVLYVRLKNPSSAMISFDAVIDRYYNTPFADDAMYEKIQILVRRNKRAQAIEVMDEFLKKYKDSPYKEDILSLKATFAAEGAD
jgi:outer membrane protein assembly factor BamD